MGEVVRSIDLKARTALDAPVIDLLPKQALSPAEELKRFEEAERERLGIVKQAIVHWADSNPVKFTRSQRASTTILFGGLTTMQDYLVSAAVTGIGYNFVPLDVPNNDALRVGKEFGNRGQCNPTYFTVGNLVKHLIDLRDNKGMSAKEIVDSHIFVTAGSCGPCRFGTYVTEYRKALRDAGFDGFRMVLFQQQAGLNQSSGDAAGLELNPTFFKAIVKGIIAGDVINLLAYRIRPYEAVPGATDAALEECKAVMREALLHGRSVFRALWRVRRIFAGVAVDRTRVKPKVSIIGEFWAMTTEGDGNYHMQRFLEQEGAEIDIQTVAAWLLYMIWQVRWDTKRRMTLRHDDSGKQGLAGKDPRKRLAMLKVADIAVRGIFHSMAAAAGLRHYHLPDMDELAAISHEHYDNHLRGGEGHMEVGKLLLSAQKRKAHMVVSVKPFGCMPSSGVSDGVQSLVKSRHPGIIFSMIETTGDGAVNALSRLQMDIFKAQELANKEFAEAKAKRGRFAMLTRLLTGKVNRALLYPARKGFAGTAARLAAEGRI
jgi:predicted nucleotide-binding protein (sugar kinase/HSP70/actin superfamily)